MDKKLDIASFFKSVAVKWKYIEAVAAHFGKSSRTVQKHWFSADNIPVKYHQELIEFNQTYKDE